MKWGRYGNVKVDYVIEQALQQVDDANRLSVQTGQELTGLTGNR